MFVLCLQHVLVVEHLLGRQQQLRQAPQILQPAPQMLQPEPWILQTLVQHFALRSPVLMHREQLREMIHLLSGSILYLLLPTQVTPLPTQMFQLIQARKEGEARGKSGKSAQCAPV